MRQGRVRIGVCAVLGALALLALSDGLALAATPPFSAHGSAEQVYVTGLRSKQRASLLNVSGRTIQSANADFHGGLVFRKVKPGNGYRVRAASGGPASAALTALSNASAPPSTSIYNQSIPSSGYGYLTTRDGTRLAIDAHPPQDVTSALPGGIHLPPLGVDAPHPTLIEYAGYGYADPAGPQDGIATIANLMGSPSSTSTCTGPAARAAPTTSLSRFRTSTAMT